MSWQKCPICNGAGVEHPIGINAIAVRCSVCKGTKLINEQTGIPPSTISSDFREIELDGQLEILRKKVQND